MEPKREKTALTKEVVDEINEFAKTNLTEQDLKAYNLHCFSDAGISVHSCNPNAPMQDGSDPPPDDESYCSLHFICAVHLGARYGVGLADGEPYDFEKSKAICKKMGYDALVEAIREKQKAEEPVESATLMPEAKPEVKVRPRRLQKAENVLTVPKAIEITDANQAKPAKKAAKLKKVAKPTKPAKKAAKPTKLAKKAAKPTKPAKKAAKPKKVAKVVKSVKKAAKAKPVAAKAKTKSKAPTKLKPKAKPVAAKAKPTEGARRRGRPRTREYDPTIHCPTKKPNYWRTVGAVKASTPDHKLTLDEVKQRLRSVGFRAEQGSRMGVLLDAVKANGGASLTTLQKAWEKRDYKLQPLTHILKIAVKAGAFSMKGDRYVLGGHT